MLDIVLGILLSLSVSMAVYVVYFIVSEIRRFKKTAKGRLIIKHLEDNVRSGRNESIS